MITPAMGLAGFNFALKLIDLAPAAFAAAKTAAAWQGNRKVLAKMQGERRDPTPEEWDALNALESELGAALDAKAADAKKAKG